MGGSVLSLSFIIWILSFLLSPNMQILFSNIEDRDIQAVTDKLTKMSVTYEKDGNKILVPESEIASIRMQFAEEGTLIGNVGYEIFDKTDMFGATSSLLDINKVRALEGELAKSISTIQGIAFSRIHLVLPKREMFSTQELKPTASVVVKMQPLKKLNGSQIQAIQYLVASSVPNLSIEKVVVVDDKGNLLAKGKSVDGVDSIAIQEEMKESIQTKMARNIELLLEKTLGHGKVRAEVNVDLDFDKIVSTSVDFNPDGQVAKTMSILEEGDNSKESSGQESVSIQNSLPEGSPANGSQSQNKNQSSKTEENTTYEISSVTKTYTKEPGQIKKFSIAVLIDGTYNNKNEYIERTKAEIDQITSIVQHATGFNSARGDIINVSNMRFAEDEANHIPSGLGSAISWIPKIFGTKIIESFILLSLGLLLIFFVIKPLMFRFADKVVTYERQESLLNPNLNDEDNRAKPDIVLPELSTQKISELVKKYPEEAASVLRSWFFEDRQ